MAEARRERADAARNRRAILAATERLLAEHPPEQVSMERVAAEAGVGKGTVFHRFGSRMGLMVALMEERALALRDAVTEGPPPMGPGAPPRERLLAFLDGVLGVVSRNKGLLAALGRAATAAHTAPAKAPARDGDGCESGSGAGSGARTGTVYDFWHGHIAALLTEARPGLDADALAHLLLGPLASDHVQRLLASGDDGRERTAAAWAALLDGVLPDGSGRADDHDRPRARPRG